VRKSNQLFCVIEIEIQDKAKAISEDAVRIAAQGLIYTETQLKKANASKPGKSE
jgi:hypothetical protein